MFLNPKVLLDPAAADNGGGGGGTVTVAEQVKGSAPFQTDGRMPDSLKSTTFDIEDGEVEDIDLNHGIPNKANSTIESPKVKPAEQLEAAKKVEEVKPKTELNIPKPEDKAKTELEVKPAAEVKTAPTQEKAKVGGRDYSAYPDDMAKTLKGMSNEAFGVFEKTYKELNELKPKATEALAKIEELEKNGFPQGWYDHDRAFSLHPQYQQAVSDLQMVNYERDFYRKQLELIEEGEEFQEVKGFNKATMEPVLSEKYKPSASAKIEIGRRYNEASQLSKQFYSQASSIETTFKQRYAQATKYVEDIKDKQWPWHKDPKDPRQKWVKEIQDATPVEFRNSGGTHLSGLMYASVQEFMQLREADQKEIARLKSMKQEEPKTEESLSSTTIAPQKVTFPGARGSYKPPQEFSMDED